jgi:hypothetical protein
VIELIERTKSNDKREREKKRRREGEMMKNEKTRASMCDVLHAYLWKLLASLPCLSYPSCAELILLLLMSPLTRLERHGHASLRRTTSETKEKEEKKKSGSRREPAN